MSSPRDGYAAITNVALEILDGEEWLVLVSTTVAALEKIALKAEAWHVSL